MKRTITILLAVITTIFASEADSTNVNVTINGKSVELSSSARDQISHKAIALLASCMHMDAKPTWGTTPTSPKSIEEAQKQSHISVVFLSPTKVEVPAYMVTLQVHAMVITLPLSTAGIWVRTDDGVGYFAKFRHTVRKDLQGLLETRDGSHKDGT